MKINFVSVLLSLIFLSGCSAFGVLESSDPQTKVNQAYSLMQQGRNLPAIRLFAEVIEIGKKDNNLVVQAQGYNGLGDVYKTSKSYGVYTENVTDYKESATNFNEAADRFAKVGYTKKAAMSYFAAGWSSIADKNVKSGCDYLKMGELIYIKPSDKTDDTVGFLDAEKTTLPDLIKSYQKKYKCN